MKLATFSDADGTRIGLLEKNSASVLDLAQAAPALPRDMNGLIALGRAGLDTRWVGLGATGGGTLRHEGYSSTFGGTDFAFTISPTGEGGVRRIGGPGRGAAPTGKGLARVDFGGGVLFTHHKQTGSTDATTATLNQTDWSAFTGASFLNVLLSGRFTKSAYDKDLKTTAAPTPRVEPVPGQLFTNASYPDQSLHLAGEFSMLPIVAPFVSFTHTRYKEIGAVKPGDTRAYTAGVRVGLEMISIVATYQRVSVTAGEDANYTNIGAGLRF